MSYFEAGDCVLWNNEEFVVEKPIGSGGLLVWSLERDFKTVVSKLSVTRASKPETPKNPIPEVPYETYHASFTRYNKQKGEWESFSIGDRVEVCFGDWDISFMKTWGIHMGHIGKIMELKKVLTGESDYRWKIYVQNPLWHCELPDKDPTIMEFMDYEIKTIEDKCDLDERG